MSQAAGFTKKKAVLIELMLMQGFTGGEEKLYLYLKHTSAFRWYLVHLRALILVRNRV